MSDQKEKEQPKPASRWDLSNPRLLTWLPLRRMSRGSDEHQAPGEFDTEDPEALVDARPSKNKQIVSLPGEKSPSPLVISVHRFGDSSSRSFLPYDSSFSASPPPPSNSNERTSTRRTVNYHPGWICQSSCVTAVRGFPQKCNENLKRLGREFNIPDKQEMQKLGIACDFGSLFIILNKYVENPDSMTGFSLAFALLICVSLVTFFVGYIRLGSACIFSATFGAITYWAWQSYAISALLPTTLWIITIAIIIYGEFAPSPEI